MGRVIVKHLHSSLRYISSSSSREPSPPSFESSAYAGYHTLCRRTYPVKAIIYYCISTSTLTIEVLVQIRRSQINTRILVAGLSAKYLALVSVFKKKQKLTPHLFLPSARCDTSSTKNSCSTNNNATIQLYLLILIAIF